MTVILRTRNLNFKINQDDHNPPHVHVEGGGSSLRVNLLTLEVMDNKTEFSKSTVRLILDYIKANRVVLLNEWEAIHGQD